MDESWRCTMGSVLPRQRSSDGQHAGGGHQGLAPDDFRDVFGGPPRTVLLSSFYGEAVDCHSGPTGHGGQYPYSYGGAADTFGRRPYVDGRGKLLASTVVPTEEGFFDDIFGARRHTRSRSRSKSTMSSSVVSSEELGPAFCRPVVSGGRDNATLSSFASKLRPIAIPSRRYDSSPPSTMSTRGEYQSSFTCSTAAYPACRYYYGGGGGGDFKAARRTDVHSSSAASSSAAAEGSAVRHHRGSSSFCCFTSNPETSSHEASFRRTQRDCRARSPADTATECCSRAADDYGYYYSPPSSAASSSLFGNPLPRTPRQLEDAVMMEVRERAPLLMDDGDIDSVGAAAVDEAIAWAKERFWSQAQ